MFIPSIAKTTYRADIDGLRAFAVGIILAYHVDIKLFSGGFVGVDIFFVISGYLLIPRIIGGLALRTFSLKDFYLRRVRRILPALFVVLIILLFAGFFILTPREYTELASSAMASLGFASNFFFYDRSDYFSDLAHQKPLLHLWSLAVEKQFYIALPLVMLGAYRWFSTQAWRIFLTLILLSLTYNVLITLMVNPSKAFYMPMGRFWEFGIGGLIALCQQHITLRPKQASILGVCGGITLLLSAFFLNKILFFPGGWALFPVLGAGLIILSYSNPVTKLLSLPWLVGIGRLSYSIYFIHWPIIVFVRLITARPLDTFEKIWICVATMLLSYLSWRYVETPFRHHTARVSIRNLLRSSAIGVFIIVLCIGVIWMTKGALFRIDPETIAQQIVPESPKCPMRVKPWADFSVHANACLYGNDDKENPIILWGDSHAGMYSATLGRMVDDDGKTLLSLGMPDCSPLWNVHVSQRKRPKQCQEFVTRLMEYLESRQTTQVIIAGRWANFASDVPAPGDGNSSRTIYDTDSNEILTFKAALQRTINVLHRYNINVVIIGPSPEISFHVPDTLLRTANHMGQTPNVFFSDFLTRQQHVLSALKELETMHAVSVIYLHEKLCDTTYCRVSEQHRPYYVDDDHVNALGARLILPPVMRVLY